MKNLLIGLILVISLINLSYSKVTQMAVGDQAQYEGVLFDLQTAKQVRFDLIDKDMFEKLNKSMTKTMEYKDLVIGQKDKQISLLSTQNEKLIDGRSFTDIERGGWFLLGILSSGLAVYGASKLK